MSDVDEPLQKTGESGESDSGKPVGPDVPPPPESKRERYTCKPDQTPGWKIILETGAVFIALGLLTANILQMRATRDAVENSTEANDISRKALYSVQRAFITTADKRMTEIVRYGIVNGVRRTNPPKVIEFTAHWENVGNTPAIGVITAVGKAVQTEEITEEQFISTPFDRISGRGAIGPKAIVDSRTLVDDDTLLGDNPGQALPRFYWGWMVYRDTFPDSKTHVTEWCWKMTTIAWKLDDNGRLDKRPYSSGSACVHHNCVDEFCEDYASITTLSPPN